MDATNQIILFDLGGVLADLRDPVASMGLAMADEEFWQIWLGSTSVREFETGRLSVDEFVPRIAAELGVEDGKQFEHRLRNWELRLFANAESLLERLHLNYGLALLSNTNEIHWAQITSQASVFDKFENVFLSFETGYYKPDTEIFEFAVHEIGCKPADVLFLDDSPANVRAARGMGMAAHQVAGLDQVKQALKSQFFRA